MASIYYYKKKSSKIIPTFFYLLYFYFIVLLLSTDTKMGGGILNQISAGFFVVFCTAVVFLKKGNIPGSGKTIYNVAFVFFIFLIIRLALMIASDLSAAMLYVRNEVTILFWVVSFLFCIREFKSGLFDVICKLSKYLIIIAFVVFFHSIIIKLSYYRALGTIGAVNEAGSAYMLLPLIVVVLKGKPKIITFLLCLVVCAWSQKRQALLGMGVSSLILVLDLSREYFKSFKVVGVVLIIFSILFSSVVISNLFSGIIERQQYLNEKSDVADNGRTYLWEIAIDGYIDAPVVEKIIGGGPSASGRYIEQKTSVFMMPHNGFIEILCDYGIIGLICFIAFLVSLLRLCFRFPQGSEFRKFSFAILMSFIVSNTFSHAGNIWVLFLCISIGIICNNPMSYINLLKK